MQLTASRQNHSQCPNRGIEHVIDMQPELSADGLFALGYWLQSLNEVEKAAECYEMALREAPDFCEAHFNLGVLCYQHGDRTKAIPHFKKAINIKPDLAEAWSAIGIIWCEQFRFAEALVCLEQAMAVNPDLTTAHYHMGVALQNLGRYDKGLESYRKALACDPDFAPARWLGLLSLPIIYDTAAQIDRYRRRFAANLYALVDSILLETPHQKRYALMGIRTCTNFYLQYQCRNDLDLQVRYGRMVHSVMAANYPQYVQPKPMPALSSEGKLRIGYVSSFMFAHTVGVFLSGWVENHSQGKFELHCYHVGSKVDALTHHIRKNSHAFHCFNGNVEAAARQIEADRLHILVYTDIGMNTETMELAALRLAPVQCKGWGHPVTTGLPTMDFYLSSDLMEPGNGDQFYSEKLVRLPNLALSYRQRRLPAQPKSRNQLGLPEDRFIYLSTQSLFKYLPQHDDIYPRIALAVPGASFVFIANQSAVVTGRFRQRLGTAFKRHGLDAEKFCHIIPRLNGDDFLSLNLCADVLLDTLEWSGGKTTLEAIDCGLPVVTCPGRFMRGRHAYAMLTMMGLTETIATDKSSYCRIAVSLANNSAFHAQVKNALMDRRHKLYGDREFIDGLERFYQFVYHEKHIAETAENETQYC